MKALAWITTLIGRLRVKRAYFLHELEGWKTDARLYRLSVPLKGYRHVVVAVKPQRTRDRLTSETYIFGSDATGQHVNFSEIVCIFSGALDHEQALRNAGYTVEVRA